MYLELLPFNWWTWASTLLKSTLCWLLYWEKRKWKNPPRKKKSSSTIKSNPKAKTWPGKKKKQFIEKKRKKKKSRELGSLQGWSEIIEKLFRIFKEERNNFNYKFWVALILQLLKLQKLAIKKPLLSPQQKKKKKIRKIQNKSTKNVSINEQINPKKKKKQKRNEEEKDPKEICTRNLHFKCVSFFFFFELPPWTKILCSQPTVFASVPPPFLLFSRSLSLSF